LLFQQQTQREDGGRTCRPSHRREEVVAGGSEVCVEGLDHTTGQLARPQHEPQLQPERGPQKSGHPGHHSYKKRSGANAANKAKQAKHANKGTDQTKEGESLQSRSLRVPLSSSTPPTPSGCHKALETVNPGRQFTETPTFLPPNAIIIFSNSRHPRFTEIPHH
jgi:hypothetical protein